MRLFPGAGDAWLRELPAAEPSGRARVYRASCADRKHCTCTPRSSALCCSALLSANATQQLLAGRPWSRPPGRRGPLGSGGGTRGPTSVRGCPPDRPAASSARPGPARPRLSFGGPPVASGRGKHTTTVVKKPRRERAQGIRPRAYPEPCGAWAPRPFRPLGLRRSQWRVDASYPG
ncbi:hypothetical protein P7K49_018119 [Saguinus oedipus]|uniref:Uncharacterized protein n=1 Tax=Saguinus oedipus TaxID=9490 RepID=A0ABQ9V4I0_SAGOE|nr:hypothetical protein P7K49_018119 [Saguinus oedipus]